MAKRRKVGQALQRFGDKRKCALGFRIRSDRDEAKQLWVEYSWDKEPQERKRADGSRLYPFLLLFTVLASCDLLYMLKYETDVAVASWSATAPTN